MNRDQEHLRLLSIFHYVCAGVFALFACFPIIHLIFGVLMVSNPQIFGPAKDQPPAIIGWVFILIGGGFILFGWTFAGLLAWSGRCLGQRRCYMYCLVMACVACLFMPFGTILGISTIIVLSRPSVKILFANPAVPPIAS